MKLRLILFLCATAAFAAATSERGELNGVPFRIDVPEKWNGGLVMFCHGYTATPLTYPEGPVYKLIGPFLEQGYALAQSAYSGTGWAIDDAAHDTEALRRYFIRKHGPVKETYLSGGSMGGFLTVAIMEKYPGVYRGGLALCGPLAPSSLFIERRGFDLRVVFDVYFPGALPPLLNIPDTFAPGPEPIKKLTALLDSKPEAASAVRSFAGLDKNAEVAWAAILFTNIIKDVQRSTGGNPFDNRNTIYDGMMGSAALNDRVARYAGDAKAQQLLRENYGLTGRIREPVLAIHTVYDPLVPPWVTNTYKLMTEQAGTGDLFVQQWVKRSGHCAIRPEDLSHSFQQLRAWTAGGSKPPAGAIENQSAAPTR